MEAKIIIEIALMLFAGILLGRLAKQFKMPNVTGYLIAGLILGPSFLNIISIDMVNGFVVISDIALGFIAFSIGSQFDLNYFRKVGIAPIVIATAEALLAVILVTLVLLLCGFDPKLSLMLGAIAAATAPAQTIMVIKQYDAKGPLTSMLMSVVAIDDAIALIAFGFAATIVNTMNATVETSLALSILAPFYEIIISFMLGAAAGILMKIFFPFFQETLQSNLHCHCFYFDDLLDRRFSSWFPAAGLHGPGRNPGQYLPESYRYIVKNYRFLYAANFHGLFCHLRSGLSSRCPAGHWTNRHHLRRCPGHWQNGRFLVGWTTDPSKQKYLQLPGTNLNAPGRGCFRAGGGGRQAGTPLCPSKSRWLF